MSAPTPAIAVGTVVKVTFPAQGGVEQQGSRPAIVVGTPHVPGPARFPLLVVVPLTSDKGAAWPAANVTLYPVLPAGVAGLTATSIALVDQVRATDPGRVTGILGALTPGQLAPVLAGLRGLLGL